MFSPNFDSHVVRILTRLEIPRHVAQGASRLDLSCSDVLQIDAFFVGQSSALSAVEQLTGHRSNLSRRHEGGHLIRVKKTRPRENRQPGRRR
jgi:hypothetical protein